MIIGGGYKPVEVQKLDLVGYEGEGVFAILNLSKTQNRELPKLVTDALKDAGPLPMCIRAEVRNNQVINFSGEVATLHDVDGVWHFKLRRFGARLKKLGDHTFFEIGDAA